jgi:hypothetical protein
MGSQQAMQNHRDHARDEDKKEDAPRAQEKQTHQPPPRVRLCQGENHTGPRWGAGMYAMPAT